MSLMEVLVVLVIVGIASGALVLGLGGVDRDTTVQIEANRFADRLRLASDEVLVSGRASTVVWSSTAYGFEGFQAPDETLPRRHLLPKDVRLSGPDGLQSATIDPDSPQPIADFEFRKDSVIWTVRYDGFNAVSFAASGGGEE